VHARIDGNSSKAACVAFAPSVSTHGKTGRARTIVAERSGAQGYKGRKVVGRAISRLKGFHAFATP
jgi:hypothetical protein